MVEKSKFLSVIGIAIIISATAFSCSNSKKENNRDEVGYNGHPFVKTPVLDEMAASVLRFDRFCSGHANCSPTRGSFMTGRHPIRYGTFRPTWSIRPEEISIAHMLKKAGYACGHFGKWHLGPVKKDSTTSPGAMGFDEWLSHDNYFELNPVLSRNGEEPQKLGGAQTYDLWDSGTSDTPRTHIHFGKSRIAP